MRRRVPLSAALAGIVRPTQAAELPPLTLRTCAQQATEIKFGPARHTPLHHYIEKLHLEQSLHVAAAVFKSESRPSPIARTCRRPPSRD